MSGDDNGAQLDPSPRGALWVVLGAACMVAAFVSAQVLTTDVPVVIEDGFEYSQGGLFGNMFEKAGWFLASAAVLLGGASVAAAMCNKQDLFSPSAGRIPLVWLGAMIGLLVSGLFFVVF